MGRKSVGVRQSCVNASPLGTVQMGRYPEAEKLLPYGAWERLINI